MGERDMNYGPSFFGIRLPGQGGKNLSGEGGGGGGGKDCKWCAKGECWGCRQSGKGKGDGRDQGKGWGDDRGKGWGKYDDEFGKGRGDYRDDWGVDRGKGGGKDGKRDSITRRTPPEQKAWIGGLPEGEK